MNQLVTLTPGGVAVTSSLAIAEGTENQHKNVLDLIRTHLQDLEDFGRVAFETRPFETAGGFQNREVAFLNQEQATLLLTHMRSIGVVKEFKKALVKAFFELARRAQALPAWDIPKTYAGALSLAAQLEEERAALAFRAEAQAQDIAVLEPKAAFCDAVARSSDTHSIAEAAKILGTGQNRLFERLREWGYLFREGRDHLPYQHHMDSGLFRVVEEHYEDASGRDRCYSKVLVTGKGMVALQRRIAQALPVAMVRPQHHPRGNA